MKNFTPESLKKKATAIRKFLNEKYEVDITHGHSLELISKVFGFKDWNTSVANLKRKAEQSTSSIQIKTVGDLKRVLDSCDDSMTIDADYEFKVNEFDVDLLSTSKDEIYQEFSLSFEEINDDIVTFKLKLEHESITMY